MTLKGDMQRFSQNWWKSSF